MISRVRGTRKVLSCIFFWWGGLYAENKVAHNFEIIPSSPSKKDNKQ